MNIEVYNNYVESVQSLGFSYAFLEHYYTEFNDLRISWPLSFVNQKSRQLFNAYAQWDEVKKAYTSDNYSLSNKELRARVFTNLNNFHKGSDDIYFNIHDIYLSRIYGRAVPEYNIWIISFMRLNQENRAPYLNFVNLSLNEIPRFTQIAKEQPAKFFEEVSNLYNSLGQWDGWIENNKQSFKAITDLNSIGKANKLFELPREISYFTGIKKLWLSQNKLKNLPDNFSELKKLDYINLSNNCFKEFPKILCKMPSLTSINLSKNEIEVLPDDIGNLNKLKFLTLNCNLIKSVTLSICNLKLESLSLSKNPISQKDLPNNLKVKKLYIAGSKIEQARQLQKEKLQEKKDHEENLKWVEEQNNKRDNAFSEDEHEPELKKAKRS